MLQLQTAFLVAQFQIIRKIIAQLFLVMTFYVWDFCLSTCFVLSLFVKPLVNWIDVVEKCQCSENKWTKNVKAAPQISHSFVAKMLKRKVVLLVTPFFSMLVCSHFVNPFVEINEITAKIQIFTEKNTMNSSLNINKIYLHEKLRLQAFQWGCKLYAYRPRFFNKTLVLKNVKAKMIAFCFSIFKVIPRLCSGSVNM